MRDFKKLTREQQRRFADVRDRETTFHKLWAKSAINCRIRLLEVVGYMVCTLGG